MKPFFISLFFCLFFFLNSCFSTEIPIPIEAHQIPNAPITAKVFFTVAPKPLVSGQNFIGKCQPNFSFEPVHYWVGFYKDDVLLGEYKVINYKNFQSNTSEILNEGAVSWKPINQIAGLNIFQMEQYANLTYSVLFQPSNHEQVRGRYFCTVRVNLNNNDKAAYFSPEFDTEDVTFLSSIVPEVQLGLTVYQDEWKRGTVMKCSVYELKPENVGFQVVFYVNSISKAQYKVKFNQGNPVVHWSTLNVILGENLFRGNESSYPVFSALYTGHLNLSNIKCAILLELPGSGKLSYLSKTWKTEFNQVIPVPLQEN